MKAELYNYQAWVGLYNPEEIKALFHNYLEQCEFEILGFMDHHFKPQGYTCIWLLGESHLAIHTYPEHERAYVELTSCVLEKNEAFIKLVKSYEVIQ